MILKFTVHSVTRGKGSPPSPTALPFQCKHPFCFTYFGLTRVFTKNLWNLYSFVIKEYVSTWRVHWCFIHVCFVQVTMWWRSRRADASRVHARTFYWFHIFLDDTTNIRRKVRAPRRISASGVPNNVQNCHVDKTNMDKTSQHLFLRSWQY